MAAIERTAYPRLKKNMTGAELRDYYTPSIDEIFFVQETARTDESRLHLLVMLKTFQRLGYFPNIADVPKKLVRHLRSFLKYSFNILPLVGRRTLYKHHNLVRRFLNVKAFDKTARKAVVKAVYSAAVTMDNPADLINVAVEELIKERSELPAFSTLDRLVHRIRTLVNRRLFQTILARLSESQIGVFDPTPRKLSISRSTTPRLSYSSLPSTDKRWLLTTDTLSLTL